jgi:cardiolipin synthase A/B
MNALLSAAGQLVALLPPSRIAAIAGHVQDSSPGGQVQTLYQLATTPAGRSALDRLLDGWDRSAVPGPMLAGILLGAAHARQQALSESSVELVWTGPTTPYVATRRTEQVLLDLIRCSERDVFLVSFVAYDIPSVIKELNAAASRGVEIRVLLEAGVAQGGSLDINPVDMIRTRVPSALAYIWSGRSDSFAEGRVHAKVVVGDGQTAFLTSANLTGHALAKNMEAGVLINGGVVPANLRSHLHALIDTNVIRAVT